MSRTTRLVTLIAVVAAPLLLSGRWLAAATVGMVLAVGAVGLNFLAGITVREKSGAAQKATSAAATWIRTSGRS